jgi:hypothetical protein
MTCIVWSVGPIEKAYQRLVETFRWVGHRFTGGTLVPEDIVSFESGDLAYTVGFERGEVSVDANASASMTIRVTHIYRHIDGEWYLEPGLSRYDGRLIKTTGDGALAEFARPSAAVRWRYRKASRQAEAREVYFMRRPCLPYLHLARDPDRIVGQWSL